MSDVRDVRLLGPARPQGVEALVGEDPVDPAEEPMLRPVVSQALEHLDERVLGSVPGVLGVPQHPQGHAEQDPLVAFDQSREGRGVAPQTARDRLPVLVILRRMGHPGARRYTTPRAAQPIAGNEIGRCFSR